MGQNGRCFLESTRIVLGLLGAIGAGKSHVARRVAALGPGLLVDADTCAHEALDACARDGRLAEALGPEFVQADGLPDRAGLAERVFRDPPLLRRLERLVHPPCLAVIKDRIEDHRSGRGPAVLVLDVALLIEVGLDRRCDVLWYVEVPEDLRVERALGRGLTAEQLELRQSFQGTQDRKRALADLIIRNDVDDDALDRQILDGLAACGVESPHGQAIPGSRSQE